jgi:hypothetical protein
LAQSYHMQVFGPEGTYLGSQEVPNLQQLRRVHNGGYFRFRRRLGQAYAHAYLRSIPVDLGELLRFRFKFFETPPGSIAKATLAAGASLMLMYVAAVMLAQDSGELPSDFPILILSIPAAISAWIGLDTSGAKLVDGTLSSRISSIFTVIQSILSSALYMAQVRNDVLFDESSIKILGVHNWGWLALLSVGMFNWLITAYYWVGRSVVFYRLANRDIQRNGSQGEASEIA